MMPNRLKVANIEVASPLDDMEGLEGYDSLQALVRIDTVPIGYVIVPVVNGRCTAASLKSAILDQLGETILRRLLHNRLASPLEPRQLSITDLMAARPPEHRGRLPHVTVAVCTRNRAHNLPPCLKALSRLTYPLLEILIVDNAPSDDATERLVRAEWPSFRYVREPRPGLDWARNRAILEARGEIIAYTDDDVEVDANWCNALAQVFAENEDVKAVTGLVAPAELETEAQIIFERIGGFGRGFERHWYKPNREEGARETSHFGGGGMGAGANMAFRREVFDRIGAFDPALDVGTVTNGGGDTEMFFRVLHEGYLLVYEPRAIVFHHHRKHYAQLHAQLTDWGIGFIASMVRSAIAYPKERIAITRFVLRHFRWRYIQPLWDFLTDLKRRGIGLPVAPADSLRPIKFPGALLLAEFRGCIIGLRRYQRARRTAARIALAFGPTTPTDTSESVAHRRGSERRVTTSEERDRRPRRLLSGRFWESPPTAVRMVDLARGLQAIQDVLNYAKTDIFVLWGNRLLGSVTIANNRQMISEARIRDVIVRELSHKVLEPLLVSSPGHKPTLDRHLGPRTDEAQVPTLPHDIRVSTAGAARDRPAVLNRHLGPQTDGAQVPTLPHDVPVSVVVATRDRPADLRRCLQCLLAQDSPRHIEIIVVDNNPTSGLTPPVVVDFPKVILVSESRGGLAYARNKGITASTGEIIITTDDDVTMPRGWVEILIAPFVRSNVMIVTGNVLPLELDTVAQRLFEVYGGLGRGFESRNADAAWLKQFRSAPPTWRLGASANAAFRATIFNHPNIGLLDEALGAGMPAGVGEDTYLFYKVLRAGYTIEYQPSAYVWHRHRREMAALRRQIYDYSRGHVGYLLTTLLRDHDMRVLVRLAIQLPQSHYRRIDARLHGRSEYPISLALLEIAGNLAGPWALWQSRRRVKREGRSDPYVRASCYANVAGSRQV